MSSKDNGYKTPQDRINELFPKNRQLPPYVGGSKDKSPIQLENERAEAERKLREQRKKKDQENQGEDGQPPGNGQDDPDESNLRNAKLRSIVEVGSSIFAIKVSDLLSGSRKRNISRPRQVISYFMLHMRYTTKEIVEALELEEDSNVHYSRNRVLELLKYGPAKDMEARLLVGLKKLCEHFGTQLPPSAHWPQEESVAEEPIRAQHTPEQTVAD